MESGKGVMTPSGAVNKTHSPEASSAVSMTSAFDMVAHQKEKNKKDFHPDSARLKEVLRVAGASLMRFIESSKRAKL